jgi:hypothetical protein
MRTPSKFARVVGARVAIVAAQDRAANARAVDALIVRSARITIAARPHIVLVGTATVGQTTIHRAWISIIASETPLTRTSTGGADVSGGAFVAVVTCLTRCRKDATDESIAAIVRAHITVVTKEWNPTAHACALAAGIALSAGVSVIARQGIVDGYTARGRNASVGRAVVAVVAACRFRADTCPLGACRDRRAWVRIVASKFIGHRFTTGYATRIVSARVVIVAIQGRPGRTPFIFTAVSDGAGITVVTVVKVGLVLTTILGIACVIRALVAVVADERLADANTGFAMVRLGAGITVQALPRIQGSGRASLRPSAQVFCARVTVIAGAFIHNTVAVVVQPIAHLGGGFVRVARVEA